MKPEKGKHYIAVSPKGVSFGQYNGEFRGWYVFSGSPYCRDRCELNGMVTPSFFEHHVVCEYQDGISESDAHDELMRNLK